MRAFRVIIFRTLALGIIMLGLAACSRAERQADFLDDLQGQPIASLHAVWGAPILARRFPDGRKQYLYSHRVMELTLPGDMSPRYASVGSVNGRNIPIIVDMGPSDRFPSEQLVHVPLPCAVGVFVSDDEVIQGWEFLEETCKPAQTHRSTGADASVPGSSPTAGNAPAGTGGAAITR